MPQNNSYGFPLPYQQAFSPPVVAQRAPLTSDIHDSSGNPYSAGQLWVDQVGNQSYTLIEVVSGSALWNVASGGSIATLTGDSGGAISPSGGTIILAGGVGIATSGAGNTITFDIDVPVTVAHGGTGAITLTGVLTGNGTSAVTANAVTNHGVLLGGASNAVSSLAVAATGTALMGSTGADPAFTGSPSFSGSVTAGTTITATLGNIQATNGNLVLNTAGNKIVSTSVGTTTAAGANSFGSVTLVGGTATVSTTAVTANSLIHIWRQSVGATGAAALGQLSVGTITAATSFVINAWSAADATSLQATDVSVIGWMIVN